ncbi:MAG: triose-phosphate isomerase [Oscillospiraceae bacterium]|nr:triose-phosphate isomerase [Oscillospiraceae bacterium]
MNKNLRKTVIAGNWKMNNTRIETKKLISELIPLVKDASCEVIIGVPFTNLETAIEMTKDTNIKVAAQNCHWASSGAFTGEISAAMLKELGVEYVILGHSERRQYFGETSLTVNQRLRAALDNNLKVIMCVGESLSDRESGITQNVVAIQTKIGLSNITKQEMKDIIIAYEPVWAIGTGKTATSDQANEVNKYIREVIASIFDKETADKTTIQYGGSMNAKNADELLSKEDIDGGLIGGASLKSEDFSKIVFATK